MIVHVLLNLLKHVEERQYFNMWDCQASYPFFYKFNKFNKK